MIESVKEFKEFVIQNEGYVFSDGTLNPVHLLSKAYDLLVTINGAEETRKEILECFEIDGKLNGSELYGKQYYGEAVLKEDKSDDAEYLWNEDVFNYFLFISPDGYHFGSSEGDGALIGWFKFDEE